MKKKKYLLYRFLEFDVVHQCGYRSFPQAERFPVISDTRTLRYLVTLLKRKKKKLCTYHSIIRLPPKMRAIFCAYILLVITKNTLAICECGQEGVRGCQTSNGSFVFCDGWESPVTMAPRTMAPRKMMQDSPRMGTFVKQDEMDEIMNTNMNKEEYEEGSGSSSTSSTTTSTTTSTLKPQDKNTSLSPPTPPSTLHTTTTTTTQTTPHTTAHLDETTADLSIIKDVNSASRKINRNSETGGNIYTRTHIQKHKTYFF